MPLFLQFNTLFSSTRSQYFKLSFILGSFSAKKNWCCPDPLPDLFDLSHLLYPESLPLFSFSSMSPSVSFSRDLRIGSSLKEEKYCEMKCPEVRTGSRFLVERAASARPSSRRTWSIYKNKLIVHCSYRIPKYVWFYNFKILLFLLLTMARYSCFCTTNLNKMFLFLYF